jgi:hypothetical protein
LFNNGSFSISTFNTYTFSAQSLLSKNIQVILNFFVQVKNGASQFKGEQWPFASYYDWRQKIGKFSITVPV